MLRAILNKSWRQHPTRHQLYSHLPPITKTIQVRRTRHAGHCWGRRDVLISDVLLWNPTYGRAKAGRPARTYIQQLYEDTGCSPEDLPEAMNDKEKWRERVTDIRASGMTWWWWWWYTFCNFNSHIFAICKLKAFRRHPWRNGYHCRFDKAYLINNISTFVVYLIPKWHYLTNDRRDKGVHNFSKGIISKVNVIA